MDPLVLIASLSVGIAVIFIIQSFKFKNSARAEDKVMKGYFLLGLSGLMAKIAMADGQVSNDEASFANRIFGQMKLTDAERAMCIGNFVTARREGLEARDHAKRFMAYANPLSCEFLYDLLWRIAGSDGRLDPAEDKLLADIAHYLGLDGAAYERFKRGERPQYSKRDLRAAGVPESLVALAN